MSYFIAILPRKGCHHWQWKKFYSPIFVSDFAVMWTHLYG